MIGFPAARYKNMHSPQRIEPVALDQERNFLVRIVGQSARKAVTPVLSAIRRQQKPA